MLITSRRNKLRSLETAANKLPGPVLKVFSVSNTEPSDAPPIGSQQVRLLSESTVNEFNKGVDF